MGFAAAFTTCIDVAAARGITLKHLATNGGRDISAAESSVRFTALARLLLNTGAKPALLEGCDQQPHRLQVQFAERHAGTAAREQRFGSVDKRIAKRSPELRTKWLDPIR